LFILFISIESFRCQFVEIQTRLGKIRGIQIRTANNNPALAFLGIPYALPPIDDRRFQKPSIHPKWSPKTLIATGYQSCCPQLDINGDPHGSEDCLYLNVFTPLKNLQREQFVHSNDQKLYPVMIYIQGESFENGDAALYGPEKFLDWNVILVTFNYRIGVLGFLSTGNETVGGNWGLYDQLLVLQWVRSNIESFRGDPNKVTLFGQGAGASSAIIHLLSPLSAGLIHRVIAQSGSPLCSWSMQYNPEIIAKDLAKRMGCMKQKFTQESIECLRRAKMSDLIKAQLQQSSKIFGEYPHQYLPVIERFNPFSLIPTNPRKLIQSINYNRLPLIMGYNQDETAFLLPLILSPKNFHHNGSLRNYLEEKLLPLFMRATFAQNASSTSSLSDDFVMIDLKQSNLKPAHFESDIRQNILYKYFNFLQSKNLTDLALRFVKLSKFGDIFLESFADVDANEFHNKTFNNFANSNIAIITDPK
ncbi:esterase-like protein 3, partial [Sarcoptes scabiei]